MGKEIRHDLREQEDRESEDDRNDAGLVQAERKIGRNAPIDLVATDLLRIGHRNRALCFSHVDDGCDRCDSDCKDDDIERDVEVPLTVLLACSAVEEDLKPIK